jgi:CubicO group peptidase (beta-lactamase class C family)
MNRCSRYRRTIALPRTCSILSVSVVLLVLSLRTVAQNRTTAQNWPIAAPETIGLVPTNLAALDAEVARGKYGLIDSVLFIRCGKAGFERSYAHDYRQIYGDYAKKKGTLNHDVHGPYNYFSTEFHPFYRGSDLHTMQSVTKTITSIIIGVAMTRQDFSVDLDMPVMKFFSDHKISNLDDRKRRMTLRHLMTMTSGLEWHEDLPNSDPKNPVNIMEGSHDWVLYTIDQPMANEPGSVWVYNSGAAQLLSHIFKQVTGMRIDEYAAEYLFKPLGIRYYWKLTPTGLPDTEGGLYLSSRDLAKIGYLFLKNGSWNGKQIVSAEWVKASVAPKVATEEGSIQYGYLWWLHPYDNSPGKLLWAAHGFGQQHLIIIPEYELVIVITGWNIPPSEPAQEEGWLERILSTVDKKQACASNQN